MVETCNVTQINKIIAFTAVFVLLILFTKRDANNVNNPGVSLLFFPQCIQVNDDRVT
jgi:hypothetical protein